MKGRRWCLYREYSLMLWMMIILLLFEVNSVLLMIFFRVWL